MKRLIASLVCMLIASIIVVACGDPAAARPTDSCNPECVQRVKHRQLEQHYQRVWRAAPPPTRTHLRSIARCESGGNHRAVSSSGAFRGLLQFDYRTWASVGGRGDPAAATRWEQWARGARLYRARGPQPWPVCRYR